MSDTLGLSQWLTTLLRPPVPAPEAATTPSAPSADAPLLVLPPMAHPNLVVLLDRARAREATLWAERHALETKLSVAVGALGLLAVGGAVAMDRLAWGLSQWHSPWHVALLAVPDAFLLLLGVRWARVASRTAAELLAERRFPFVSQSGLGDPFGAMGQNPDTLFATTIQDMHASNNALEVSLRKQQEKLTHLLGLTGRLGGLMVLLAAFGVVGARALPAPAARPVAAIAPASAPAPAAKAPAAKEPAAKEAPVQPAAARAPSVHAPAVQAPAIHSPAKPAAAPVAAEAPSAIAPAAPLPAAPHRRQRVHRHALPVSTPAQPAAAIAPAAPAAPQADAAVVPATPAEPAPRARAVVPAARPVAHPAAPAAEAPAPRVATPVRPAPAAPATTTGHSMAPPPAEPAATAP